ncbi:MAG TPA: S8 family serine peptidase [Longimicrobiaceae bacterium]|nr:S8 family serine peptidase [Longimicrobiaceae bacterium]
MKSSSTALRVLTIGAVVATAACEDARDPISPAVEASHSVVSANDEYFGFQWGLRQIGAQAAWSVSTGKKQVIAIVDTGMDLTHPDLQAKLVPGATFTGCADTGPCGNGDWKSGTPEAQAEGFHPHGTHVAGIAAAITGNGRGIAGVAPAAKIMPVKVLTNAGGSFPEIAAGIRWAVDNGADVINLSLGALPGVQLLPLVGEVADAKQAINYAVSKGVVVVAAAGNDFASICGEPSFSPNALCVVATDSLEQRAAYSNFALHQDLNVVAAPGGAAVLSCEEDIISTVPVEAEGVCTGIMGTPGGYDVMAGTSMATPHVAGVAALLTAQGRDVFQVYDVLKRTARTPVTGLRGFFTPTHGYGIVDAAAAVAAPR